MNQGNFAVASGLRNHRGNLRHAHRYRQAFGSIRASAKGSLFTIDGPASGERSAFGRRLPIDTRLDSRTGCYPNSCDNHSRHCAAEGRPGANKRLTYGDNIGRGEKALEGAPVFLVMSANASDLTD